MKSLKAAAGVSLWDTVKLVVGASAKFVAKTAAKKIQEESIKCTEAKASAADMSDERLVSALNHSTGIRKAVYVKEAKARGSIGYKDGKFYVK